MSAVRTTNPSASFRARPRRSALVVLGRQRHGDALQGLPVGPDTKGDLDDPAGDHQGSTEVVEEGEPSDVPDLRGTLDQTSEQQGPGDPSDGSADRVEDAIHSALVSIGKISLAVR